MAKQQSRKWNLNVVITDDGAYGEPPFEKRVLIQEIRRSLRDLYVKINSLSLGEITDAETDSVEERS